MWQMMKHRLGALIGRRRLEKELDDELAFHCAMAAERGSERRFGNDVRIRESAREQWMIAWLEHLHQDLRYAARALRRSPAFTAGVVVTLALGIGATSAIFGLAYGVLWQPLPYPAAARIVELRQGKGPQQQMMNSSLDVVEARQRPTGLHPWVLYRGDQATLTGAGEPAFLGGAVVESGFWSILGVKPLLGRLTLASDDRAAAAPVIVISEQLWRSHFGARRGVVGERVVLEGEAATIVGVAPAWFHFPGSLLPFETGPQYWHSWQQAPEGAGDRDVASLARLAPGATLASVQLRLDTAMRALAGAHPADRGWRFQLTPLRDKLVGQAAPALELMLAVVLTVMLIAAINIACLLLARAERRQQELATRVALGASRGRIARQLLTEAGLLAVGGLAAGFGVAVAGIAWLRAAAPAAMPRLDAVGMDWGVVAFTAGVAVGAALLFGLAPALGASRQAQRALVHAGRGEAAARRRPPMRGRSLLVAAQVALTVTLCAAAGLLLRSFLRLTTVPMGFNPNGVLAFELDMPQARYANNAARGQLLGRAAAALAALPGARGVAAVSFPPLTGEAQTGYALPGKPLKPFDDSQTVGYNAVGADYFHLLNIPVLAGRGFLPSDTAQAPPVTVISARAARQLFGGRSPIGKRIRYGFGQQPWRTVVGIVGDVRSSVPDEPSPADATAYVPLAQSWVSPGLTVLVRTAAAPTSLIPAARHAIAGLDSQMPLIAPMPLSDMYRSALAPPRFRSLVVVGFAGLALLLSAVGLFGLLSYAVAGRRRELGVRTALGAQPRRIVALVVGQAALPLAIGIAAGLAGAWAVAGWLAHLLFGIGPLDPASLAAAALLMALTGGLAAWLPARRALALDPADVLRCE